MLKKPVDIHIYDADGKPEKTFKLCFIPWKFMKKATTIFSGIDEQNEDSEKTMDAMTNFLVELFNSQFTADELNEHGDATEVMQAIKTIMGDVNSESPNSAAGTMTPLK